jgi:hypothetical protein
LVVIFLVVVQLVYFVFTFIIYYLLITLIFTFYFFVILGIFVGFKLCQANTGGGAIYCDFGGGKSFTCESCEFIRNKKMNLYFFLKLKCEYLNFLKMVVEVGFMVILVLANVLAVRNLKDLQVRIITAVLLVVIVIS